MLKFFGILLNLLLVDFYYFPFSFRIAPAANLKLVMAVAGLAICLLELIRAQKQTFQKPILIVFLISSVMSLVSYFSVMYNHTTDYSYVSYAFSAMVWLSGAFTACYCIKLVHGEITVGLLIDYLVAVCVIQSVMAIVISHFPAIGRPICEYTTGMHDPASQGGRLYSVGVAVDVAGSRFATILASLGAYMCAERNNLSRKRTVIYWLAFIIITLLGSMVARTTIVGTAVAFLIMGIHFVRHMGEMMYIIKPVGVLLIVVVAICVWKYNTDNLARHNLRFGFEGFFSLVETGHWKTNSNDILKDMVKWPEKFKTWVIGDGYFENALTSDINYLGVKYSGGYYMGTDIGYLRFIFYCGLIGLFAMFAMVIYPTVVCCKYCRKYSSVFIATALCGFLIWLKVATDVWYMLALYMCVVMMLDGNIKQESEV